LTGAASMLGGFFGNNKPKQEMSIFGFGAVDEFKQWFTTPDGKFDSGFYLAKDDLMLLQAELVNYRKEEQKVFLQIDVEYVDGKSPKSAATTFATATSKFHQCQSMSVF
jgi:hypothetical protein